jgi:holo-[acyl-carrier protein] synthase
VSGIDAREGAASIGLDLVEPERIRAAAGRWGSAFLDRIFTREERTYCDRMADPWPHYAARFAAKEAFAKALGTGVRGFRWTDVSVAREASGRPALRIVWPRGIAPRATSLSLTHTRGLAGAVVLLGGPGR